ncbi:PH domain-containing protein [Actinotalea sp. AC32]|nr:PH domain-containing protein [Actinotalea sp. AC32]
MSERPPAPPGGHEGGPGHGLYRPFRPRSARVVSTVAAWSFAGAMVLLGVVVPREAAVASPLLDRLAFVVLGLAGAWFLLRHAGVRADPDTDGLVVRNLVVTRRVTWAEVVSVRFGHGRPWVQLDLADGTTLAVMGIQRSDGARAVREARRLATLVARHSGTARDD